VTKKIKDLVRRNPIILRILPDAYGKDCLVVEHFSKLQDLEFIPGIDMVKKDHSYFILDERAHRYEAIYEARTFSIEKEITLKNKN